MTASQAAAELASGLALLLIFFVPIAVMYRDEIRSAWRDVTRDLP